MMKIKNLENMRNTEKNDKFQQKLEKKINEVKALIQIIKDEKARLKEEMIKSREDLEKEMKRKVTEMSMRVSDMQEQKKLTEKTNSKFQERMRQLSKEGQVIKTANLSLQQRVKILEQEKLVLIQLVEQMKEGVDQEVKFFFFNTLYVYILHQIKMKIMNHSEHLIAELQETKLTLGIYIEENQRLTDELGEVNFKLLTMENTTNNPAGNQHMEIENERMREEIAHLREQLKEAEYLELKLKEKDEEIKALESSRRNQINSFGSINSNHRDSTGYMVLKNPNSETKINSKPQNPLISKKLPNYNPKATPV